MLQLFISIKDLFSLDLFNFAFGCTIALAGAKCLLSTTGVEHEKKKDRDKKKKLKL